jgi:RNA-directed DNA polymerase
METITDYVESKLKLKVNRIKSKVSRPNESTLLGFSFYRSEKGWEIRIAPKSLQKIKEKMKGKTKRNDPASAKEKIKKMEAVIRGWVNYFSIAKAKSKMKELDEMVRTRLRIGIWKQCIPSTNPIIFYPSMLHNFAVAIVRCCLFFGR